MKTIEYNKEHRWWSVYKWGTYPKTSVLAGQAEKQWLDSYDTREEAKAAHPYAHVVGEAHSSDKSAQSSMNSYEVTFRAEFPARSEEECYDEFLDYLRECVNNGDVTAFNFVNLTKLKNEKNCV